MNLAKELKGKVPPKFLKLLTSKSEELKSIRTYDENQRFYLYALTDPRKPGSYEYHIGDRVLVFTHEPFYIGKGVRSRSGDHTRIAKRNPNPVRGQHKLNKIRKLLRAGLTPNECVLSTKRDELSILALECLVIKAIGRADIGEGPLTNKADGGDGPTGMIYSEKRNRTISEKLRGKPKSEEHRRKLSEAAKGRVRTPEHQAKLNATRIGRKASEETKEKQRRALGTPEAREANRQRALAAPKFPCPTCGKLFRASHMVRHLKRQDGC